MNGGSKRDKGGVSWLVCDCEGSQSLDCAALQSALGDKAALADPKPHTALCGKESETLAKLLHQARAEGRKIGVACAQEADVLHEIDAEIVESLEDPEAASTLLTADIRDRAGWSKDAAADPAAAAPKMAALLAEAAMAPAPPKAMQVVSEGVCLIAGPAATVLPAAERLADRLSVTALLTDAEGTDFAEIGALSPRPGLGAGRGGFDVVAGRIRQASGALGGFALTIDAFAEREPGGRGGLSFGARKNGAQSDCDVILDLTGEAALFPAPHKRDGYLRADPKDALSVERALFDAADLSGEFDKTLHIAFEASLCAHSRARQPGCDRCLSVCPTGAITAEPGADHVEIDPHICAGCGSCAAVCPSGAALFEAPSFERQTQRLRLMLETYAAAAPDRPGPRLLIHDNEHGAEMIRLASRYSDGLPADVLPLSLDATTEAGHALLLAAFGLGYRGISVLAGPKTERAALDAQIALTERLLTSCGVEAERLALIDVADPEAFSEALYAQDIAALDRPKILALGAPRTVTRQALAALAVEPEAPLDLTPPEDIESPWPAGGAPYGAVLVDREACTLCLSCVSLCPSGALADNEDKPELRFQEDACLQCGICANACPEDAITYAPRFNLDQEALAFQTLHEEEPFACIECGALFGVKSTIERIAEKLGGTHWMYTDSDNLKLLQMCDSCRVTTQMQGGPAPFQMGDRPKTRTTQDYLDEREAEQTTVKKPNGGGAAET